MRWFVVVVVILLGVYGCGVEPDIDEPLEVDYYTCSK